MAIKTLYTAVGRFERRTNGCNRSCPIILLGGQEYMVDMQEMVIWSMLNWRILRWDDIAQEYEKLSTASGYCTERSWEDCTNRLLTRGLLVSGSGETEYDALYDLLGSLSITAVQIDSGLHNRKLFRDSQGSQFHAALWVTQTEPQFLIRQFQLQHFLIGLSGYLMAQKFERVKARHLVQFCHCRNCFVHHRHRITFFVHVGNSFLT